MKPYVTYYIVSFSKLLERPRKEKDFEIIYSKASEIKT